MEEVHVGQGHCIQNPLGFLGVCSYDNLDNNKKKSGDRCADRQLEMTFWGKVGRVLPGDGNIIVKWRQAELIRIDTGERLGWGENVRQDD